MDNLNGVMHYRSHYENFDGAGSGACFGIDVGSEGQRPVPFPGDYFASGYQGQGYVHVESQQAMGQFGGSVPGFKCSECGAVLETAFALKDHADRYHRFGGLPNGHHGNGGGNEAAEILDLDSHKVHVYQPPAPPAAAPPHSESRPASPEAASPPGWTGFGAPPARTDYRLADVQSDHAAKTEKLPEGEPGKARERNASGKGGDRTSEGGRPKTYSCEPCGKWFTSNGHLKRHFNTTLHKNATKSLSKAEALLPLEAVEQQRGVVQSLDADISGQQVAGKPDDGQAPFLVPEVAVEVAPVPQHFSTQPMVGCDQQRGWMMPVGSVQSSGITMDYSNQQAGYQGLSYQSHGSQLDSMAHYNGLPQQTYQAYGTSQPEEQYQNQMFNGQEKKLDAQAELYNRALPDNVYFQTTMPVPKTEQGAQGYEHVLQQNLLPPGQAFYSNGSPSVNHVVFNNNNVIRQDGMLESTGAHPDVKVPELNLKDSSTEDNSTRDSDPEEPEEAARPEVVSKAVKASGKKKQPEENGTFKCTQCDKAFNRICYLTQHNNTFHKGDKPFKCHLCGKRFQNADLFDQHQQKHAGDKPYKCSLCPKQFNHKTDLRRHMCLHTGQKPFMCQICSKGFIRKDHMVKHAQTHTKRGALHAQQSPAQPH